MAVLVEAISVIVRRDAINKRFSGGWHRFESTVPNSTLCADDDIARVGFMSPADVEVFVRLLENGGLTFLHDRHAVDIAVVDQLRGPTSPADWLEFSIVELGGSGNKVAACWLFEGERMGRGIHFPTKGLALATPPGWRYENSLTAKFKFVESAEVSERMKFVRHEAGKDVYLDLATGKEVYMARSGVYIVRSGG
ncbi:MAG: hypothetical protein ABSG91_24080 [Syntrophobacteraceae bacterium]